VQRFKDSIREAEKSTLIFNLDMGKVPLLNSATISKKTTLALPSMAAKVENPDNPSIVPSRDTVAAIDDILSVTTGMTFYGSVTKTYRNPKDNTSGSYCTIPVRYDFRDRKTRMQAESILRSTCNVNCATPYPAVLRECIKQTGEFFRGFYNTSFVRVNVSLDRMSLRVLYKIEKDSDWTPHDVLIPIPKEALDIGSRRAPKGFKMTGLIPDAAASDIMDTSVPGAEAASSRPSRKDSGGRSPVESY
jgi:hypothetical protein